MKIGKNTVVRFHYTLTNEAGETIDSSRDRHATAYLHGAGNIVPGLEAEMQGREAGDSFETTVPPEQGYGQRREDGIQRVPAKHFKNARKVRPGDRVSIQTQRGNIQARVVKVGRFHVDVDTNHPLAGETLNFAIEIVSVREATREEIQHGHAHGSGGHQH